MVRNLFVLLSMFIAFAICGIVYVAHVQAENNHKWCALMRSIDIPNPSQTTPRAVEFQRRVHILNKDLGCIK